MRTLTLFFVFSLFSFSDDKITIKKEVKPENIQPQGGWRKFSESKKEIEIPCWEKEAEEIKDPSFCLYKLEMYKNTLGKGKGDNIQKKNLEIAQDRLKKLEKVYYKTAKKQKKQREQENKQQRKETQAYYDANVNGCPSAWVNPNFVRSTNSRVLLTLTIVNQTNDVIDIGGGGYEDAVKGLCPKARLTLRIRLEWYDSVNKQISLVAMGQNTGGVARYRNSINFWQNNYNRETVDEWLINYLTR